MAPRPSLWMRAAAAVLSGVMIGLSPAPTGWWPLHWFAFVPLLWALDPRTPRTNLALAVLQGTAATAVIFRWIADTIILFSNIPAVGAYAITVLFAVVYGTQYPAAFAAVWPLRRRLGRAWVLALPAWVVLVEWVAARVLLFPYQTGVTTFRVPWLIQLASVTGVWGLSFVMVLVSTVLGEAVYRRREGRPPPWGWIVLSAGVVAAVVGFGAWRHPRVAAQVEAAPVLRVQQIQTAKDMLHRLSHPAHEAFDFWLEQTRQIPPGSVDLVVWPEGAVPYSLNESTNANALLWELVRRGDFDLVVGSGTREREPDAAMGEQGRVRMFNSVYVFARDAIAPAEEQAPSDTWAHLQASGCDLDAAHLVTPFEVAAVRAAAGEGAVGPCVEALAAREQALRQGVTVSAPFEQTMARTPGLWSAFRAQSVRFPDGFREDHFRVRGGLGTWRLVDPACVDDDCAFVLVVCRGDSGCVVHRDAPHYDKMVPLPFGEYLPLAEVLPWLRDLIRGPGNFRAGTEPVVFDAGGVRFATPICYEGILSYVCNAFEAPDLLVNVTNDAWFGDTAASELHGMLVAIRATELGIPVFRSAYAGVSFVAEADGTLHDVAPLYTEVNRPVRLHLARLDTVYARHGDWFVVASGILLALALALSALRPRTEA
ncbi:MAG: hypothetical protein H6732_14875 [Alphaproteobacteria bacterium]|nr:hypothetical protein [Alphaproteobacteria bacterium]